MYRELGFFNDVVPNDDNLYSLGDIYNSNDCIDKYWTPKRWLAQKRTKALFDAHGVPPSILVSKELATSYATTVNVLFYINLVEILEERGIDWLNEFKNQV